MDIEAKIKTVFKQIEGIKNLKKISNKEIAELNKKVAYLAKLNKKYDKLLLQLFESLELCFQSLKEQYPDKN